MLVIVVSKIYVLNIIFGQQSFANAKCDARRYVDNKLMNVFYN